MSNHKKYTCPMHPEVVKEAPGKCPICNMDLIPLKEGVTRQDEKGHEHQHTKHSGHQDPKANYSPGSRFDFWQRWLVYTSLLFALFGIVFAVYGNNPVFKSYNDALAKVFWNTDPFPAEAKKFRAFIWAPLGGTIACCYILLAYIAMYPFKRKERWARNAIIAGFGIWITIDSLASLYYGVYFQFYVINAFSFLIKALPILFTWNDFQKH